MTIPGAIQFLKQRTCVQRLRQTGRWRERGCRINGDELDLEGIPRSQLGCPHLDALP